MTRTNELKYPTDYIPRQFELRMGVGYNMSDVIEAIWDEKWSDDEEICGRCGESSEDCECLDFVTMERGNND